MTALERNRKNMRADEAAQDTEKRDQYKVYGELIHAYGYGINPGAKSFDALNYYTNEMMTVPLDPTLTPQEMHNAISINITSSNVLMKHSRS